MNSEVFIWTLRWARLQSMQLWAADETASTNTVAKDDPAPQAELFSGEASQPRLYVARQQSSGRGRSSNTWANCSGALLSSWRVEVTRAPQPILAPILGLALYDAASDSWPEISFNLKAPNDLYIGDRKVAGLLIETVDQDLCKHTVIGLGLNVLSKPAEVATATCIAEHTKEPVSESRWQLFLSNWSARLRSAVIAGLSQELSPVTAERLCQTLNKHPLLSEPILEIDPRGQLRLESRTIHWHEL